MKKSFQKIRMCNFAPGSPRRQGRHFPYWKVHMIRLSLTPGWPCSWYCHSNTIFVHQLLCGSNGIEFLPYKNHRVYAITVHKVNPFGPYRGIVNYVGDWIGYSICDEGSGPEKFENKHIDDENENRRGRGRRWFEVLKRYVNQFEVFESCKLTKARGNPTYLLTFGSHFSHFSPIDLCQLRTAISAMSKACKNHLEGPMLRAGRDAELIFGSPASFKLKFSQYNIRWDRPKDLILSLSLFLLIVLAFHRFFFPFASLKPASGWPSRIDRIFFRILVRMIYACWTKVFQ